MTTWLTSGKHKRNSDPPLHDHEVVRGVKTSGAGGIRAAGDGSVVDVGTDVRFREQAVQGGVLVDGRGAVQRLEGVQAVVVERDPVLCRWNRKYCASAHRKYQPGVRLQLADPKQTFAVDGAESRDRVIS